MVERAFLRASSQLVTNTEGAEELLEVAHRPKISLFLLVGNEGEGEGEGLACSDDTNDI